MRPKLIRWLGFVGERGVALIAVLLVIAIFTILTGILLLQGQTEHVVAVNEQDHLKTLGFAEAGLTWAQRRLEDADVAALSDVLNGPDDTSTADDNLIGLRDLSLTSTGQFNNTNEGTKSAIVQRDFTGEGNRTYEVIRLPDGQNTRTLVYVRIDDNFDDDSNNPTNNDPLTDTDMRISATAVAEYPVFVDDSGAEMPNKVIERGRARRTLVAQFEGPQALPAIATNGDIDISGNPTVCGECGSVHTNQNMNISGSTYSICEDATASGSFSGNSAGVGGESGGGYPPIELPIINPYDDLYVPALGVFDTLASPTPHLQCAAPTAADPGNAKYFALVADGDKGRVFKAYWDFVNNRWRWKMIDDLSDGTDVKLDDCGRAPGDPNYLVANQVDDGKLDEFYGFKGDNETPQPCAKCTSAGADESLCTLGNNNFAANAYYDATTGALQASVPGSSAPALPGSRTADGQPDFDAEGTINKGKWDYSGNKIYSPMQHAVVFVYGHISVSGNPGDPDSADYCYSAGCGSSIPSGRWQVSFLSYGDITISGTPNVGPANPQADYHFLLISGRDIKISGNPIEDTPACPSDCSTTTPAGIEGMAGVIAAHEQVQISGSPNIFGFIVAEDAIDCSTTVSGKGTGVSTVNGNPEVFYDCSHPPNPWALQDLQLRSWQEAE